ncbi:MAG: hypothetical protein GY832_36960, partial [Chloroflexi bacterium]|nr:hypothetical protein [Chloroflexota bacterium]
DPAPEQHFTVDTQPTGSSIYLDGNGNLIVDLTADGAHIVTLVIIDGSLIITDTGGPLVAGDGVTQVDANTINIPFANILGHIQINGAGNDDTVTLDFGGGAPIPASTGGGVVFDGGDEATAGDSLLLENMGAMDSIIYNYRNLTDGSILVGNRFITYTGLEPIFADGHPITATFNLTATNDTATLTNLGDDMSRLSGDTFEDTDFGNPQADGTLIFNLGDGDDTLILSSASLATDTTFIVDGQGGQDVLEWETAARIVQASILDAQVDADLHFSGSTLPVVIGGTEPGESHDTWTVMGANHTVTLTGVALDLSLADGYTPTPGDAYVLIDNEDAGSGVVGTFADLPEGTVVTLGGVPCRLTYAGGDGNDVVLAANAVPTISNIGNQVTDMSVPLSVTFTISDTDDPVSGLWVYAESSNLELVNGGLTGTLMLGGGMSIDCIDTQCTLWITPTTGITGTTTITVTVDDSLSAASDSFVLAVGDVNVPPEFTSSPVTVGTVGVLYTYDVTASDPNVDDTLTITATTKPIWLALTDNGDGTATLSGTPTMTDTYDVVLEVSDGEDNDTQAFTITVDAAPVADSYIYLPLVLRLGS